MDEIIGSLCVVIDARVYHNGKVEGSNLRTCQYILFCKNEEVANRLNLIIKSNKDHIAFYDSYKAIYQEDGSLQQCSGKSVRSVIPKKPLELEKEATCDHGLEKGSTIFE